MNEQNYLTKNKFTPVFLEAFKTSALLEPVTSPWLPPPAPPFPTVKGCSLDYVCTLQPLAGAQYCPQALINPD